MIARWTVAGVVLGAIGLGVGLDLAAGEPLNPFRSPALLALGSGESAGGAHCSAVPGR